MKLKCDLCKNKFYEVTTLKQYYTSKKVGWKIDVCDYCRMSLKKLAGVEDILTQECNEQICDRLFTVQRGHK